MTEDELLADVARRFRTRGAAALGIMGGTFDPISAGPHRPCGRRVGGAGARRGPLHPRRRAGVQGRADLGPRGRPPAHGRTGGRGPRRVRGERARNRAAGRHLHLRHARRAAPRGARRRPPRVHPGRGRVRVRRLVARRGDRRAARGAGLRAPRRARRPARGRTPAGAHAGVSRPPAWVGGCRTSRRRRCAGCSPRGGRPRGCSTPRSRATLPSGGSTGRTPTGRRAATGRDGAARGRKD